MKIFVYEQVTGGGMTGAALSPDLCREADLMVRTLLDELSACGGVELLSSRDSRLPPVPGIPALSVGPADDPLEVVARGIDACDAVWPTAPETGGVLERLSAITLQRGRILLGSRPGAVRIAGSKLETSRVLRAAGLPAVETFAAPEEIPPPPGRWVTKPDDGVAAAGARIEPDWMQARDRLAATDGLVAQPWIEGDPVSLSLLCAGGQSVLLSCNRQRVESAGARIRLRAIEVNAFADEAGAYARLAARIAAAIPGLWGYVGVDLVVTDHGAVVLEVNPRLTTSYCGLGRALGFNVAAKLLDLLEPGALERWRSPVAGSTVHLDLEAGSDS